VTRARTAIVAIAGLVVCAGPLARAASEGATDWLPALVLGGIVLFVAGVLVRMFFAARFPRGYRDWAARRREKFAQRNEAWDREDEERRK
jgi:hypothetical protein